MHGSGPRTRRRSSEPVLEGGKKDLDYVGPEELRRVNKIRRYFVANVSH